MEADEMAAALARAAAFGEEEARGQGQPGGGAANEVQVLQQQQPSTSGYMTDADIRVLRSKHLFLSEFSDNFIRMTPIGDLMKIESTALKAREIERAKDADDRLALNKSALASTVFSVPAGSDNRWSILHQGRFLGGACCSAAKLWLTAREYLGTSHAAPVGNYDLNSCGLAGYISARG
jgi:hypothetical protein